ncbi:SIR2 family protein [Phenylobacterium sp.]|uniref:SIR2 family protein n=1 Tax=Phenylobacterium sp. TaxID=1871053 RepID=UPI002BEA34C8|nr:SIR2 family protein [Phenylobacterium sp.]HVI33179.1 SIR2 family protein [Phenylobacterium sp.]
MSLLDGDRLTQLAFTIFQNKGVYALLLGSGLSRAAEIPTGWEVTLDLVRRVALAQGVEDQADWADWYRKKTGGEPSYSDLLAELALSPDERRAILHGYIEPSDEDREAGRRTPTRAHKAIAELVAGGFIRVIVTTNFDRLLETALRERGIEPTVVSSVDALAGAEPLSHTTCYILKVHGDYKDARILNTDEELSAYPDEYNQLLDRIFDEHGLIVAGWSGAWDHALRAAMLRAKSRRYSTFWSTLGDLADGAKEIVEHRRGVTLQVADADSFFTGLAERVETLRQTGRRNPLSIELIVASAKRYLSKPEHRIQLDDLISETAADWMARVPNFDGSGSLDGAEWKRRAGQHEAATEAIAKLAAVLGRWGTDSELPAVLDLITMQVAHADDVGGGYTSLLGLRSYPAVMVFTAYALGLIRAERLATLHKFLVAPLRRRDEQGARRMVDNLLNYAWRGNTDDLWKRVAGFENRKTAFSDMQCDLFKAWLSPVLGFVPDFELLYERFEVLGALAHFEQHDLKELEGQIGTAAMTNNNWVWTPVGRVSWDRNRLVKLREELEPGAGQQALLAAGFGRNNSRYLDLFVKNLDWISSRRMFM